MSFVEGAHRGDNADPFALLLETLRESSHLASRPDKAHLISYVWVVRR